MSKIIINIDGKDYEEWPREDCLLVSDKMIDKVWKDYGSQADFLCMMAEKWMIQKGRTRCQICTNPGNGAIAIGKHGAFPNVINPYEEKDEIHPDLPPR
jgi:hypothetical protein